MVAGDMLMMLLMAAVGAVVAALLSIMPALHIYNVAGFIILAMSTLGEFVPPELLAMFFLGLITGYAHHLINISLKLSKNNLISAILPLPSKVGFKQTGRTAEIGQPRQETMS